MAPRNFHDLQFTLADPLPNAEGVRPTRIADGGLKERNLTSIRFWAIGSHGDPQTCNNSPQLWRQSEFTKRLLIETGALWRLSADDTKPVGEMSGFGKSVADALSPATSANLTNF